MSFKLAHLSDIHAGYRSGRRVNAEGVNLRAQDGYDALRSAVDSIIEEEVDAVVIAGDTMHVAEPDIRSLIEVQTQLRRLAAAGIKVYMLAGNHETTDIRADIASSKIFDDPWRGIHSYATPYEKVEIADGIWLHLVSHHMYGDQAHTMNQVKSVDGAINIFSTHGSAIDPLLEMALHAEMSPREIVIPDALLEDQDWDYVLLGHIHERGWVGSKDNKTDTYGSRIYYNGSILRRGFSDKEVPLGRGWTLWTIEDDGSMSYDIRTVHQRTQLDFKAINAKKLSAAAITEKIIDNLRASQGDTGTQFFGETAPILRQQITNLTPAKQIGLDWKSIDRETGHAFMFLTKKSLDDSIDRSGSTVDPGSFAQSTDVVQVYDKWAEKSEILKGLSKDDRKETQQKARAFVRQGQEGELESDD